MDFNQYKQKLKSIDQEKKKLSQKMTGLKKMKLKTKFDEFSKRKEDIQKKMNKYVNGASSY